MANKLANLVHQAECVGARITFGINSKSDKLHDVLAQESKERMVMLTKQKTQIFKVGFDAQMCQDHSVHTVTSSHQMCQDHCEMCIGKFP